MGSIENLSGQSVKGYELLERIGAGGFGTVYRANQPTLEREVAIKVIQPAYASSPDFIRSFEIEAQLVARLEHLYIVPLYDYWRDPTGAYLIMRWMRGGSLRDVISEDPLDLADAALMLDQLASGLTTAHSQNIIHRDLKPSNILLDQEGNVFLADFGIAKDLSAGSAITPNNHAIVGSTGYMAPEQALGDPVTPQTDIYSLGITLYEALSGQHPYPDADLVKRLYQHLNDPLPWIETLPPDVSAGVNRVLQKATDKNPDQRYLDVQEMAHAFRQAADLDQVVDEVTLVETLTYREHEILRMISQGYTNKQIAQNLFIELSTVKWHITQLYRKLRVRSRVQAIIRARELDLIVATDQVHDKRASKSGEIQLSVPQPVNPYKGLRPFDYADNRDFFGREALIEAFLARLDENSPMSRFLAVVGPSGSGKSSAVNAGLIPALWSGRLPGSERWFIVKMSPGSRPLDQLEVALTRVAAEQGSNLHNHLHRDKNGLLRVAELILPQDGSSLLLVIDQFEELFTLVEDESVQSQFLDLLHSAVTDPRSRVRVIVTLRADLYDRPLRYPDFGELIPSRMVTVLPLSADELERAIVKPAEQVGVTFEPGLVATIIEDVLYQPGALPLLQYALTELFEGREDHILTKRAYNAIGRTVGALAKRAEQIYKELDDGGKEAARQMFLRLVNLGEGSGENGRSPDTRRRVPRSELLAIVDDQEQMDEIIDTFGTYRLLSMDHDPANRRSTVEIAHEAILDEWERLAAWLDESREDLLHHRRFAILAKDWYRENQDPGYLLRDARLDQFTHWAARSKLALTAGERGFLEASITADEKQRAAEQARQQRELETAQKLVETESRRAEEKTKSIRRLRWLALGLTTILLIATVTAFLAWRQTERAEFQTRLQSARQLAAAAQSNLEVDPELSILLALQAVNATYAVDHTVVPEAEAVLHQAVSSSHLLLTLRTENQAPGNWASDVAFSPDGTRIATTYCADKTAVVWDATTGERLLTFDHGGSFPGVWGVAYNHDGTRLATGGFGATGVAKIWDATTGRHLLTLSGHSDGVNRLVFSPDGSRLATTSADRTVKVWDAITGQELLTLPEHNGYTNDVAFSPDGKLLASGDDRSAYIWDTTTGERLLTLDGHTARVWGIAINPDGTLLATASADRTAKVWDLGTGQTLLNLTGHNDGVRDVAFSPDGTRLATASLDGTSKIWDLATGKELVNLAGHTDQVLSVAFSPDGTRLVTSSIDQTAKIWDISPDHELLAFHSGTVYDLAISPDGTRIATTSARGAATLWNPATGRSLLTLSDQGIIQPRNEVEFTVDGARLAPGVAFSPDGKRLATASVDNTATIWNVNTGQKLVTLFGHNGAVNHVAFSPDGDLLATSSEDMTARIWNSVTGEQLRTLSGHTEWVRHAVFSPDGAQLVTTSSNGEIFIWDTASGKWLTDLTGHTDKVTYAAYSPDGAYLATASGDGTVKIWDMTTWREIRTLYGHTNAVNSVIFSKDGKRLVTASADGTARIWDAANGQELLTITSHPAGVGHAVLNADETRLITADWDNIIRYRVLPIDELIAIAQERVTRTLAEDECKRFLHLDNCPSIP